MYEQIEINKADFMYEVLWDGFNHVTIKNDLNSYYIEIKIFVVCVCVGGTEFFFLFPFYIFSFFILVITF